ncbi:MAG TPA: flagellar motor protein MotB [Candidatus Binatia bacterium]|nr:flagellar motor protein MotB [Candidatus Binatia bacterium]
MAEDRPRIVFRKKKGGHGGGHHGGSWKVAYADFVTSMMALFMVLWLLTQADLRLRSQIAQYFRNQGIMPGGAVISQSANEFHRDPQVVGHDIVVLQGRGEHDQVSGQGPGAEGTKQAAEAEQKRLETQAKAVEAAVEKAVAENPDLAWLKSQVIIEVTDRGLAIEVVDKGKDLLFDLSSAELKPPMRLLLTRIAAVLCQLPNRVEIAGHTDSRPYPQNSPITNWELSFARANNARRVLEAGLWPGQITRVLAYADTDPLVPDDPFADENRRLSILAERQNPPPGQPAPSSGPVVLPPDTPPGRTALATP